MPPLIDIQGSTRQVSLLRIALVLLIWTELAARFRLVSSLGHEPLQWIALISWVLTPLMLLGVQSQLTTGLVGLLLLVTWQTVGLGQQDHGFASHHYYMLGISTCWLALTPCGGSFSVDRWLAVRQARAERRPAPPEHGPLWALWLLRLQIVAMYLYAAWDKSDPYFGNHFEQAMRLHVLGGDFFPQGVKPLMDVLAYGSVVLEYVLPFALLWRPTRNVALVVGILFHFAIYWTLSVSTFSATMTALYLVFLDPDEVHAFIEDLLGHGEPKPDPS